MNTIELYSAQGQLAWAAYATLQIGSISRDRLTERSAVAMPDALAETLSSRYAVLAIHNDPLTGAYAVLFSDADGKQTLAVRGTEDLNDVVNDWHLLTGIPAWMNLQYQSLVSAVEQWTVQGLLSKPTTLTGHSLGGYLAAALKSYYPNTFSDAYTFNAPGYFGALGSVAQFFKDAFGIAPQLSQVHGFLASQGLSLIAGTGSQLGTTIPVEIEPAPAPGLGNHSVSRISQSLAVFAMLSKLSPQLDLQTANRMLMAASNQSANALESLIYSVDRVLNVNATLLATGNDQALYSRLNELQSNTNAAFKTLATSGAVTLNLASAALASTAKADFGAFLSLQGLSPVVLSTGSNAAATAVLQAAHPSLYADWNADKNARLYGDTSKQPTYSDNWYTDRAAMLQALVTRNEKDLSGYVPGKNTYYEDVASNTQVLVGAAADLGSLPMVRFGSAGAEPLEGGGRTLPLLGTANKLKANKAANNTQWRVAA